MKDKFIFLSVLGENLNLIVIALFLLCTAACNSVGSSVVPGYAQGKPTVPRDSKFTETDAIVVFHYGEYERTSGYDKVRVYDENGDIWYEANFTLPAFDSNKHAGPNKIRPFTIDKGDFTPEFRCVATSADWYKVIVDEGSTPPVTKFIRKDDALFEFKSWEEYFVKSSIRFNSAENPVLDAPGGSPGNVTLPSPANIEVLEMRGDWIKIYWEKVSLEPPDSKTPRYPENLGWIRWRKGTELLVYHPRD